MNLLHVCSITNNKTSGISNVVPEHFINQSKFAKVALLNCNNTPIERLKSEKNVFYYNEINKNIDNLPKHIHRHIFYYILQHPNEARIC